MTRYYFHGDVCPAPEWAVELGLDARWFQDDRLKKVVIAVAATTRPTGSDLRLLRHQLRTKRALLSGTCFRPDDAENVFKVDRFLAQDLLDPKPATPKQKAAEKNERSNANDRAVRDRLCRCCGYGARVHLDGNCLFGSAEWAPGA